MRRLVACLVGVGLLVLVGMLAPRAQAGGARNASSPSSAASRPAPTYAGRWSLLPSASVFGGTRKPPRSRVDVLSLDGPWVNVHSVTQRDGGDSLVMDFRYRTDGEAVNKVMGQDMRTVGRREGASLCFDSQARVLMLEVKVAECWTLSAAGDSLIMRRDSDSPLGREHQRLVFGRAR